MVDLKKRWRAYLRSIHRDFGYLAIGFTVIYAVSGIAQNHIEDWGDVSFVATERTFTIPAIPDTTPDIVAVKTVADAAGIGIPVAHTRISDEIRLEYANGDKVTAIGREVTVQTRARRAFIGLANWLHTARHKKSWKYISDAYAVLLLYLAISGIFMIKGHLGLKWRGTILISSGIAVPILYVALAGGPDSQKDTTLPEQNLKVVRVGIGSAGSDTAGHVPDPPGSSSDVANPAGSAVLRPLPPDDN
jgi:hypothetical protein